MALDILLVQLGELLMGFQKYALLPIFSFFKGELGEKVAVGLALGLLLLAFMSGTWFYFRRILPTAHSLNRLISLVEKCENENVFKDAYVQIDEAFCNVKFLKHGWEEFKETLIVSEEGARGVIQNTQRPGLYLNSRASERFGPNFHFFQALPNYFVGVGLLLTFFGLVAALYFASEGIQQGAELPKMQEALRNLLHAATFKFLTSIAGLGSSIGLSVQYRLVTHGLQLKFDRLCDALERRMAFVSPEQLLDKQLKEQKAQTLQLERFNTDFAIELSKALEERLNKSLPMSVTTAMRPLTDAVEKMAGNLGEMNQDALSQMVGDFKESLHGSAGSEMTAITQALGGISASLEKMSAGVNSASSDFGRRIEDAAIQLEKIVSAAGNVLQEQASEAAGTWQEQMRASAGNLRDAIQETSQSFTSQMREASEGVGDALMPLASQIEKFETLVGSLDARLEAQRDAVNGVVENVKSAGEIFKGTAQSLQSAAEPIASTAGQFTKSAEEIRVASQAIAETQSGLRELAKKIGETTDTLSGSWADYESRFKDVDESLSNVFSELLETAEAHRTHIQDFVVQLDKQFSNALKHLGGGIEQLNDSIEDLGESAEKFTKALG